MCCQEHCSIFGVQLDLAMYPQNHKVRRNVPHFRKYKQQIHFTAHITFVYLTRDLAGGKGCCACSCLELTSPPIPFGAKSLLGNSLPMEGPRQHSIVRKGPRYFPSKSLKQAWEKALQIPVPFSLC